LVNQLATTNVGYILSGERLLCVVSGILMYHLRHFIPDRCSRRGRWLISRTEHICWVRWRTL